MHQRERIKVITELLQKNGFVTVKFLTEELHYSTATVNRDLNVMQNMKLIHRSYGGAELTKSRSIPLHFRYQKMKPQKNLIGKRAAALIEDGDTVFIDGATTSQYIGKYMTGRKELTVITNNLSLASFLSEQAVRVILLGGQIVEPPAIIVSTDTVEHARRYQARKAFFSVGAVSEDGKIGSGGLYGALHRVMVENAEQSYLLADHDKIGRPFLQNMGTFADVTGVISDYEFSDETKARFPDTVFYKV